MARGAAIFIILGRQGYRIGFDTFKISYKTRMPKVSNVLLLMQIDRCFGYNFLLIR